MKRTYQRIHPSSHRVMVGLHVIHGLTYQEIADLFGCSRGRVVQIITEHKEKA